MRLFRREISLFPLPLLCLFCFLCLPFSSHAQEIKRLRIGVARLAGSADAKTATEARDELVRTLNHYMIDPKLGLTLEAVALDDSAGNRALAEASKKKCEVVLFARVAGLDRSSGSGLEARSSGASLEADTALLEYELRRPDNGSVLAMGTAKSDSSYSSLEAVLAAVSHIPRRVVTELGDPAEILRTTAVNKAERVAAAQPVDERDMCGWLPNDIPHADALRRVCEYAATQPHKMPNFICRQDTSRYLGGQHTPADLISANLRYVDGEESFSDLTRNGKPISGDMWSLVGLWSSGQLVGNLAAVFDPRNQAVLRFAGDNSAAARSTWVFTYQIAQQNEPLWKLRAGEQLAAPPYEGEIWVDQNSGILLRFRASARDFPKNFLVRSAEMVTDYDSVSLRDGTAFVLPLKSTIITRYSEYPATRNVVEFRNYRKFRATARMVFNEKVPDSEREVEARSAELATELQENEEIYSILRDQAIHEDDIKVAAERQLDLRNATGEAFWKLAQLGREREKLLASAAPVRPPSKYGISIAANGDTKFMVYVRTVPVSVVVRDREGRAVGNLNKEDFQIFDNRKPQEIVTFSIEKNSPETTSAHTSAVSEVHNSATINSVAYVFDDLHTLPADLAKAKAAVERRLSRAGHEDRFALFTTAGDVTLDFTRDRDKFRAALGQLKSHSSASGSDCPAMDYYTADLISNHADPSALEMAMEDAENCMFNDVGINPTMPGASQSANQMDRIRQIVLARAFEVSSLGRMENDRALTVLHEAFRRTSGMLGRKSIVLLSPGFMTVTREQQEAVMYLIEHAVDIGVVFGAVDVRGLAGLDLLSKHVHTQPATTAVLASQGNVAGEGVMADLAYGTGGTFFHSNNDLEEGLRMTADAPGYVYLIGFTPKVLDGKFHKLKVTAKGAGKFTVQARQGYYALRPPIDREAKKSEKKSAVKK